MQAENHHTWCVVYRHIKYLREDLECGPSCVCDPWQYLGERKFRDLEPLNWWLLPATASVSSVICVPRDAGTVTWDSGMWAKGSSLLFTTEWEIILRTSGRCQRLSEECQLWGPCCCQCPVNTAEDSKLLAGSEQEAGRVFQIWG